MAQKQGNFVVYETGNDTFVLDKLRGSVLVADTKEFSSTDFNTQNGFPERVRASRPQLENFFHTEETVNAQNNKIRDFETRKKSERPTTFFIAETISCPLSCTYCFEADTRAAGDKKRLVEKDIEGIDRTIIQYRYLAKLPSDKICLNLFGGEPLQPAFFGLNEGLLDLAKKRGYFVDVITSGATMTPAYLDLLSRHRDRIREVDITLDGVKETHDSQRPIGKNGSQRGSYDLVVRAIDQLLERGVRVLAKQNLGNAGLKDLERHVGEMQQRGWYGKDFVHGINLIQDYGGVNTNGQKIDNEGAYLLAAIDTFSKPEMKLVLERTRFEGIKFVEGLAHASRGLVRKDGSVPFDAYPRYAHCHPTDGTTVTIAPNGDLYGCNWSIGKTKPFGNIFRNPDFASLISTFVKNVVDNPLCSLCNVSTSCGGGCRHAQMMASQEVYHLTCQDGVYKAQKTFLEGARQRGLFDRKGRDFLVASDGFNFNYAYENRAKLD